MGERSLQTNQLIRLEVAADPSSTVTGADGIILDMFSEKISIGFPDLEACPAAFVSGAPAVVKVTDHFGIHWANTRIVQATSGREFAVLIERPEQFETTQQRRFFRVTASVNITFSVVKTDNPEGQGKRDLPAVTDDLSAGGLRFLTPLALAVGDIVHVVVRVPNEKKVIEPLGMKGTVLRSVPAVHRGKPATSIGIEFLEVPERIRNILIRYLYSLQRITGSEPRGSR